MPWQQPTRTTLIDCRDVDNSSKDGWPDLQVHQYDRLRPEVIADITEVFAGTPPEIVPNRDYNPATRIYRIKPTE